MTTGCHRQVDYDLIPHPAALQPERGAFHVDAETRIVPGAPGDAELLRLAGLLRDAIASAGGPAVALAAPDEPQPGTVIRLIRDGAADGVRDERYTLTLTATTAELRAPHGAGLFYAVQTFVQMLPAGGAAGAALDIPAVTIEDAPRFAYRGMHLDVGRHFFPVAFVKKYIDLLAAYKMNTFHWHLTEDQGWRIAIEKYPRLTEIGAYRAETIVGKQSDPFVGDGTRYGGFYTQDEIREVVAYARDRYVTIVPEIELPGHSSAAIAAYPELGCTDEPVAVATRWGVFDDIYCPSEATFAFLEDVLDEVVALFPGPYVHIGGDEAPKRHWEESPVAQAVIRREGLADEHELQSWFIRRIERYLLAKDRRMIGWDEILEGGLAPEATVMSWRGTAGGIEAARQGHDVVMTPTSHCYFDFYQADRATEPLAIGGYTPLENVYAFEPVPDVLSADEARHVLGAQGNVWTEYLPTPADVEYMAVPRMLALAEVVWSPAADRSWDRFSRALGRHYTRLDDRDVAYRVPPPQGLAAQTLSLEAQRRVVLTTDVPGAEIRYAVGAESDQPVERLYEQPVGLTLGDTPTVVTAVTVMPSGRRSRPVRGEFVRTRLRAAEGADTRTIEPGVVRSVYDGRVASVRALDEALDGVFPSRQDVVAWLDIEVGERTTEYGVVFEGVIDVPVDGVYRFFLTSDDGSGFAIGEVTVVDHDGLHAASTVAGSIALERGHHAFALRYFQAGGARLLRLEVEPPGGSRMRLPAAWLYHRP